MTSFKQRLSPKVVRQSPALLNAAWCAFPPQNTRPWPWWRSPPRWNIRSPIPPPPTANTNKQWLIFAFALHCIPSQCTMHIIICFYCSFTFNVINLYSIPKPREAWYNMNKESWLFSYKANMTGATTKNRTKICTIVRDVIRQYVILGKVIWTLTPYRSKTNKTQVNFQVKAPCIFDNAVARWLFFIL